MFIVPYFVVFCIGLDYTMTLRVQNEVPPDVQCQRKRLHKIQFFLYLLKKYSEFKLT